MASPEEGHTALIFRVWHKRGKFYANFPKEICGNQALEIKARGSKTAVSWRGGYCQLSRLFHSSPGMMRFMNSSKRGTVKAVSPWVGLQIMPLAIRLARCGPKD